MGALSFAGALPSNAQQSFEQMVSVFDKVSLWDSSEITREKFRVALQARVQQAIATQKSVESVLVIINDKTQAGVARRVDPTASVTINTRGDAKPRDLAKFAANTVARSVSGLKVDNVAVSVDGKPIAVHGDEDSIAGAGSGEVLEQLIAWKGQFRQSIEQRFDYIPGLRVQVNVTLNRTNKVEERQTVDPTQTINIPSEENTTKDTTTEARPAGEPGAVPNVGLSTADAASTPPGSNSETSNTKYTNDYGKSTIRLSTGAGDATVSGVSVGVPRSYFVTLWKSNNPQSSAGPTDADLQPMIDSTLLTITKDVKAMTKVADSDISVTDFADLPVVIASAPVTAGATAGVGAMVGGYGKEIAVGVLALASLFMVSRLVKKSTPAPLPPPVSEEAVAAADASDGILSVSQLAKLEGGEMLAGEVAEGGPVLIGQELDDETIEAKQMLEQVQSLVKDNPDAAAQLVKRWLNRS
ncbi:MAG: flagellar M-ring protein FliF C-terminal domain-containing protein [Tepidisphaeraceae bacterium]